MLLSVLQWLYFIGIFVGSVLLFHACTPLQAVSWQLWFCINLLAKIVDVLGTLKWVPADMEASSLARPLERRCEKDTPHHPTLPSISISISLFNSIA